MPTASIAGSDYGTGLLVLATRNRWSRKILNIIPFGFEAERMSHSAGIATTHESLHHERKPLT